MSPRLQYLSPSIEMGCVRVLFSRGESGSEFCFRIPLNQSLSISSV